MTSEPSPNSATPPPARHAAVLAMRPSVAADLFDAEARRRLLDLVEIDPDLVLDDFTTRSARVALASADVLVTGWGCPPIDEAALESAPRLRAVVHTAGSVKPYVTEACWRRGIEVSSAASANAVPVAEYTLAAILFANKRLLDARNAYRAAHGRTVDWHEWAAGVGAGNYRRRVGIVGASRVGRRVLALLRSFDLEVLLNDPHVDPDEAARLGATLVSLPELFAHCDVVSLHAPHLPSTEGMISRDLLTALPDGATLINTARGALVDQQALEAELLSGRISAVLDVTTPEVLPASSPLYTLPNVLLTPHVAGSMGGELARMAAFAIDELERWTRGEPFLDPIRPEAWDRTA